MGKRLLYPNVLVCVLFLIVPLVGASQESEILYSHARSMYRTFWVDEDAKAKRANWLGVISAFEKVHKTHPRSPEAPKAYYMAGKLSYYCFKYHGNKADFNRGKTTLGKLIRNYPDHNLADDARYFIAELYLKAGQSKLAAYHYRRVIEDYPEGDMNRDAKQRLEQMHLWPMPGWLLKYRPPGSSAPSNPSPTIPSPTAQPHPLPSGQNPPPAQITPMPISSGRVLVREIKHFSSGTYTRVVIYCKQKVTYGKPNYIPPAPEAGVDYPRLFIDINDSRLAPGVGNPKKIDDGLLRRVRAGQNSPNVVRVVLDIDSIDKDRTRVFPMEGNEGNFRIIIDVTGKKRRGHDTDGNVPEPKPENHSVRRIVLDPGHGGKDPGAIGPKGTREKDVALKLALKTAKALKGKTKADVLLTRYDDRFLSSRNALLTPT